MLSSHYFNSNTKLNNVFKETILKWKILKTKVNKKYVKYSIKAYDPTQPKSSKVFCPDSVWLPFSKERKTIYKVKVLKIPSIWYRIWWSCCYLFCVYWFLNQRKVWNRTSRLRWFLCFFYVRSIRRV
jgi:hypothetical protein